MKVAAILSALAFALWEAYVLTGHPAALGFAVSVAVGCTFGWCGQSFLNERRAAQRAARRKVHYW